ncbi:MAG: fibronectin type III domain-containing protein [Krumholzibacteria bacterium]|nr:fibronectin type III domain-containing protein [Candidatus Krumholzibacteria bacterium]
MRSPSDPIRTVCWALLATVAVAGGATLLAGCESKPAEPAFDNPWDPDGPLGGDALQVRATAGDTTIAVTWTQPQGYGITLYVVSHTLDAGGDWEDVAEVNHSTSTTGFFSYRHPEPTLIHYFRVQAFSEDDFSIVGYGRNAAALTPPSMLPATGGKARASRFVDLVITVNEGDSLRLADNDTFNGAVTIAVADLGEPQTVPWDLGPAAHNTNFSVYVKAVGALGLSSPRARSDFTAAFAPRHDVVGRPATLASRTVDLAVPTAGMLGMRFALSAADLEAAPWLAPADTVFGFLIAESANPQQIHAEYEGDFGYNSTHVITVTPDNLAGATFTLDVPPNRVIDAPVVTARNGARATLMRFAEGPGFTGVPWLDFRDTVDIALSAGEGRKVIYAQFRNDWADSPVLTQYVDVVVQPVAVAILAPAGGATLAGGTALQVRGTAIAGSASDRLDSVRVDLGDGLGWRTPTGTASWSLMWSVPVVATDTPRTLRARAWATDTLTTAVDSATAVVTVTVEAPELR